MRGFIRILGVRNRLIINRVHHLIDITVRANIKFETRLSNFTNCHKSITGKEQLIDVIVQVNRRFSNRLPDDYWAAIDWW